MKTTEALRALTPAEQKLVREHMEQYDARIRRFALSYLGPDLRDALDDVVQDTYLALCRQIDTFKTVKNPEAYTITIVARRIARIRQKQARYISLEDDIPDTSVYDPGLKELLPRSTPEKDREVLERRYVRRESTEETAEAMGIQEATIRQRIKRALDRLKKYFKK